MTQTKNCVHEELKVSSETLLDKIKELIHEGNVRHIVIKTPEDHTVFEIPVNFGLVGAVLLPIWAAVAAIAVYASHFKVVVTRDEPTKS